MTKNSEFEGGEFYRLLRCQRTVWLGATKVLYAPMTGLFRAGWSAAIHEEWMKTLLEKRPDLSREKLERTRMLMDKHLEDALVTCYEDLIEGLHLPDPGDRHVLAAAIRGRADVKLLPTCGISQLTSWLRSGLTGCQVPS